MTTDPRPPVLRVTSLGMRRDDAVLLRDVSWEVRPGEHWIVLGANGSGKTSLLGALTLYAYPSGGEIDLLGHRYGTCDWRELRKRVGVVSSGIHSHLLEADSALHTVASGKYAAFGPWFEADAQDLDRARDLLVAARAEQLADRPWRVLSQGERQRVLIARALMADPDVLLLDEPCAGLDPVARERVLRVVDDLAKAGGPTLILVTHHIEEIAPSFTHVLVLRQGTVVAQGPKAVVLTSEILSRAFDHPVSVRRREDRFELDVG